MSWAANPPTRNTGQRVGEYAIALLTIVVVTFALWATRSAFTQADISLLNLLAILALSIRFGGRPTLLAVIVSFFTTNFFFIEPIYTFHVTRAQFIDLCIYLVTALVASQLGDYSRRQGEAARRSAEEQKLLHSFSSSFNRIPDREGVYDTLRRVLLDRLGAREVTVLPGRHEAPREDPRKMTSSLAIAAGEQVYATVQTAFDAAPTPEQSRLIEACVVQASMALQRIELTEQAQRGLGFEEADRLKTALLRAVSHDLRTPITIIKTSASNLQHLHDRLDDGERLETLEGIEGAADHLDTMVGHLLDLSRLQAGAMPINREWNALSDIVADVAARVWELYRDERIRVSFPPDMPPVRCDAGLILQALGNVIENALRYEPAGSLIEVRGGHGPFEVTAAVVGHGKTIPGEQKERVMEPFNRQEDGHLGLGLAISKGILEAHRGRIWVEDTPGGGATFVIALPRDPLEEQVHVDSGSR
jgi:two-component system sensor histidine kinase KdpD